MEKQIGFTKDDFTEDRYSRLRLIPWWDQDKLKHARVMVVGAGAIGNELIKNLSLLGVGTIFVVDMDEIEHSNLTRSVLFRREDVSHYKADVAAMRGMELNPDVCIHALCANVVTEVGLGLFRRMDVVLGGLDNREARLSMNQSCYKVNIPWIDGAIEALGGFARVFIPPEGPCYECTMTEADWQQIRKRKSCALLTQTLTALLTISGILNILLLLWIVFLLWRRKKRINSIPMETKPLDFEIDILE